MDRSRVRRSVFNLHACVRAFLLEGDTTLSPSLILAACQELRPSVVNTVPWIVEGLMPLLQHKMDGVSNAAVLQQLHMITYGGAAPPE